jgi:hypothetical protein
VMTVLNSAGITVGGSNVFVALVVCGAALRAVEATFKLHGRFAHEPDEAHLTNWHPPPTTESAQAKSGLTPLEWALVGLALLLVMVLLVVVLLVLG